MGDVPHILIPVRADDENGRAMAVFFSGLYRVTKDGFALYWMTTSRARKFQILHGAGFKLVPDAHPKKPEFFLPNGSTVRLQTSQALAVAELLAQRSKKEEAA